MVRTMGGTGLVHSAPNYLERSGVWGLAPLGICWHFRPSEVISGAFSNLKLQLKVLASNEMMKTMFQSSSTLATISMSRQTDR